MKHPVILVCSLFTVPSSVPFLTFLPFLFLSLAYVGSYDVSDYQSRLQGGMDRSDGVSEESGCPDTEVQHTGGIPKRLRGKYEEGHYE